MSFSRLSEYDSNGLGVFRAVKEALVFWQIIKVRTCRGIQNKHFMSVVRLDSD